MNWFSLIALNLVIVAMVGVQLIQLRQGSISPYFRPLVWMGIPVVVVVGEIIAVSGLLQVQLTVVVTDHAA